MKTPSVFWNIQLTKGFKKSYGKLSLKDKWIVKHFLNDIRYLKEPKRHYAYETCKNCPPSHCLFGIADDGIGNKGVSVLIITSDNKILVGIIAKKV